MKEIGEKSTMNPLQILINNAPVQLGGQLPTVITHLNIRCMMRMSVNSGTASLTRKWLNDIVDKLDCDYVEYNGVLISVDDIVKFEL